VDSHCGDVLQAPLSRKWQEHAKIGMLVEVPNVFVLWDDNPVYWIGEIIAFAGYKALVSYETFDEDLCYLAWISFCSDVPKPVGYCATNDVLLFPPYGKYIFVV